jgi:hypothetical protein
MHFIHTRYRQFISSLQIPPSGKHVRWVAECVNVPQGSPCLLDVLKFPKIDQGDLDN